MQSLEIECRIPLRDRTHALCLEGCVSVRPSLGELLVHDHVMHWHTVGHGGLTMLFLPFFGHAVTLIDHVVTKMMQCLDTGFDTA